MKSPLRHDHEVLLQSLLKGKLPRSVAWSDVVDLIEQIGEVQPHEGDQFVFVVGSQRAFFKRPAAHELDLPEISRLRSFLKVAELTPVSGSLNQPGRMVVVIDHHAARLYHDLGENRAHADLTLKPYDPYGFHRRLIHRKEAHYRGERVPEEISFYEEVAQELAHAEEIVLVGHAKGKSSAMDFLAEYLKTHHPTIARRVVATEHVDLSALTEPEIETIARKHLDSVAPNPV